jgi:predicted transcriptional regulator of viral defense system
MTAVKILQKLPQLFRYADVEKYTGNANVFLTRALKNGLVERIARGVYINAFLKNRPEIEDVACFLRTPSYISCEWALNRHGILLQSPLVCTVLTLSTAVGLARNVQYGGATIEFSHLAARLFTGFETREGYNMALPEKALLDTIYLRKAIPFPDELEIARLDKRRLEGLASPFPMRTRKLIHKWLDEV